MLEKEKMTEYSCLGLKLAFQSGTSIYKSSVRKREMRGIDDGIVEINNGSNFLR